MKQSITVIISSVLTIGLLVSPVAAKSTERSNEVLNLQQEKVENSKVLPSKYVFYKYLMNKGESTPFLYKLLLNATEHNESANLKDKNKQDTSNVKEEVENKEINVTVQNDKKKQKASKTPVKVEQQKNDVITKASEESNATAKESVQVPTKEKTTTSNAKVEEQPVAKTPETSQPTQSKTVNEQQSQTSPVKEQPTQQVSDSIMLQVVDLTNKEREKAGLQPLQVDSALMANAQEKSLDMKNNNYFSHQSPTLGSPFDQMKKRGIAYKAAGENIAKGQTTAAQVVEGWMNSAGHRANILDSKYTHIGVGYVAEGNYWTQQFIQK